MPLKIAVAKSNNNTSTNNNNTSNPSTPNSHHHHHHHHHHQFDFQSQSQSHHGVDEEQQHSNDDGDPEPPSPPPSPSSQSRFVHFVTELAMPPTAATPLLRKSKAASYQRCASHAGDELHNFRSWLRWMCVDQTATWSAAVSWIVFLTLGIAVPAVSHFVLSYSEKRRSYDTVVEASLTSAAALSFLCLSAFVKKYGLRRFLFLDKLCRESEKVRLGYTTQLNRSFKLLSFFVVPCFLAETGYKIWWYCVGAGRIPFLGNPIASDIFTCVLELCSWLYRTSIFFLVCVLFRLICHLQILRLQDFAAVFQEESDVALVLTEHLRIRRELHVISHRFRIFIVITLILVTFSQLASLLLTTSSHSEVNFFNTGELALCSIGLVTGILICLRSAAKITHKAQAITSHAAKWHVCATIESFDPDPETPTRGVSGLVFPTYNSNDLSDDEVVDDDDLDDSMLLHPHANTISFQKRQALVTYLENNRAGITVYGFMLDRAWLHTIFAMELTVFLWLLGKTLGFS